MALSSVTLATLRDDLRARLPMANRSEILDPELDRFLNLGQYDTAIKLSGINNIWYGDKQTVTISSGEIDISSYSIMRIIKLIDADNGVVPFFDEKDFEEIKKNSAYDATRGVSHFGTVLDVYAGTDAPTVGTLTLYYYRKPVAMTSNLTMDVPDEFQDMVVSFAEKKAMQRLGLPTGPKEEELMLKWRDIQQAYSNEYQAEKVGERGNDQ
jgi:hypothetical protein